MSAAGAGDPTSDDLDELLDSALDDFTKLDLAKTDTSSSSSSFGPSGLGGMGLPDRRKGKQRATSSPAMPRGGAGSYASEALEKLTQQTRETVRGLETVTAGATGLGGSGGGGEEEAMVEELVKQFEQMAGSQDLESVVETMMQQLLSKDILHEPMKELASKYPAWLARNESALTKEELTRYARQQECIERLNEVYEQEPENYGRIVEAMQRMQECGQPPEDLVKEIAPDLDVGALAQMSQGMPGMPDPSQECSIM